MRRLAGGATGSSRTAPGSAEKMLIHSEAPDLRERSTVDDNCISTIISSKYATQCNILNNTAFAAPRGLPAKRRINATHRGSGTTAVASNSILPGLSSRSDTKIMLMAG